MPLAGVRPFVDEPLGLHLVLDSRAQQILVRLLLLHSCARPEIMRDHKAEIPELSDVASNKHEHAMKSEHRDERDVVRSKEICEHDRGSQPELHGARAHLAKIVARANWRLICPRASFESACV